MATLQTPCGRVHVQHDGVADPQAPLMVLLHPVGLHGGWWSPYARHYREGWRVAALDLPGHGLSVDLQDGARLGDLAEAVASVIAQLGGSAHVVGASMGGMVAQELALRHPDCVASLVLLSTVSTVPDEARQLMQARATLALTAGMDTAARETAERWAPDGVEHAEFRTRCYEQVRQNDARNWALAWQAISRIDTWDRLVRLDCPTLVGVGARDSSTPPAHARAMADRIGGAQFLEVPAAGHMAVFSRVASCLSAMNRFYAHVAALTA